LLRVVAVEFAPVGHFADTSSRSSGEAVIGVIADPGRRLPGRGAHIHPDPECLARAERRRAFGRALRVTGVLDTGPLARFVADASAGLGTPMVGPTHPGKQGRKTDMSTR
jgi:hypothetical protein